MVKIAVAGGTGTAGRMVVAELVRRGFEARALSRHNPEADDPQRVKDAQYFQTDVRTGNGLEEALAGVDAVIETLDGKTGAALRALPETSRTLLRAAQAAGIGRAVLLSIVNSDKSDYGYYKVQAERASLYRNAGFETTVVYATQFHDLIDSIFASGARIGLIPAFRGVSFQPIATADAATALVDAAVGQPHTESVTVGGPEVLSMQQLARQWKASGRGRGLIVPVPLPGSFGRFLRSGQNLVPDRSYGGVTFQDWLAARQGSAAEHPADRG